ncbi:MAG: hypothetical protein PHW72_02845 [Candidatus Pacebacteria bacterium]|nr:hypothetical protein [Candidatus Paceibacterota bacterium]
MKYLIIADQGLDGVISAASAIIYYDFPLGETEILFTQPFALDRVEIPEEAERIVVVDVGFNNENPEMTRAFIKRLGSKLLGWFDHHSGWPEDIAGNPALFVIIPQAKSCGGMIPSGDPELRANANIADTHGELSPWAQIIEEDLKVNPLDNEARLAAVHKILKRTK